MKRIFLSVVLSVVICSFTFAEKKIKIVAATSHIYSIVREICKDEVDVVEVIPYNMCPGHFDFSTKDIEKILKCDVFLCHGWERWIKNMDSRKIHRVEVSGNWMVPKTNIVAAGKILQIVSQVDSKNKDKYKKNFDEYVNKISIVSKKLTERFKYYIGSKVICSKNQEEFVRWLGLDVVYSFSLDDQTNVKDVVEMLSVGEKEKVELVIENLQSGSKMSQQLAKDLGVKYVVLSNFPEECYIETLKENVNEIIRCLR